MKKRCSPGSPLQVRGLSFQLVYVEDEKLMGRERESWPDSV